MSRGSRLTLSIICAPFVFVALTMVADEYRYPGKPSIETFLLSIIAFPFLEEFIFRGLLHEKLLSVDQLSKNLRVFSASSLMVAVLFALTHVILRGDIFLIALFFPALLVGVHYEEFGQSWMLAFLVHAWFNFIWVGNTMLLAL